jgi:Na+-driven multidrug efflux pump
MNFLKKEPIDDLNDISYVNPEIEYKSTLRLTTEILTDSIFNILPILLLIIIDLLNLIFIGHMGNTTSASNLSESPNHIKYFNYFQVGVAFMNLFGFAFALGVTKTIKKGNNIQKFFYNTKIILITLTLCIILPMAILSYYLLSFLYANEDPEVINMIYFVYTNFILYSPIFIFFTLLLQLNLRALELLNDRSSCFWIFSVNIILHSLFLYIFLYILNWEIFGVMLSLILSSFISYIYSNAVINENVFITNNNFYFLPEISEFYSYPEKRDDLIKVMQNNLIAGFVFYSEYSGFGFFLLFSLFINETALTVNIILLNFFSLLHIIGQGFSYTMRHYIRLSMSSYKHSHIGKKKYVKVLSVLAFFIALTFAVIILSLDGSIVNIYLNTKLLTSSGRTSPQSLFSQVITVYALIIFFDYISKILDGYVKGIDAKTTHLLIYKISFFVVFVPVGLVLCFASDFGLYGFWIAIYAYIFIYSIINAFYVYKYYAMWFH